MATTRALAGQAQTVLGPIAGEAMGITLPHEHLLIDFEVMFREPGHRRRARALAAAGEPGEPRVGPPPLQLQPRQPPAAGRGGGPRRGAPLQARGRPDLRGPDQPGPRARSAGAGPGGPGNRPQHHHGLGLLRRRRSPPGMDARTVDDIARELVTDLTVGVDGTGVRAVFIGEIGTTWPWTDNEKKVVRAAVAAQCETGAALMIHPGRHERLPLEIVSFIRKEGADLGRTIMCHIERTIADPAVLLELAATGVYQEYDLFGLETSYYPYNPAFDMPNDGERMRQILFLIERGHLDQILMSHDIAYKHCLTKWGGFGYHHLLVNVIPRLRAKGADDKTVQTLLIDNPRRAFAFA